MTGFERLVDDALKLLWETQPVTASFAGETAYDGTLPPAGSSALSAERARLGALGERLERVAPPDEAGARLDARFVRAYVAATLAELAARPRFHNPAWYTGEAAFGIVALLLRPDELRDDRTLHARIAAIPDFLAAGRAELHGRPLPAAWVARARSEAAALVRLLGTGLPLHPWAPFGDGLGFARAASDAVTALERFANALAEAPDADPACGSAYLASLMRVVHGLAETPDELERSAAREFEAALAALVDSAARLDASRSWREQVALLAAAPAHSDDVLATFRTWHARAQDDAQACALVTPAHDYALRFACLPQWAQAIASDLYFLFYRSPAARTPGTGSIYWVDGAPGVATIKLVHAVHHGSIGHHTQNARARAATSRFARIAGTDGASGLALLSAGTLVEGWACYAEDLMAEVPDFYTPAERVQLDYFALRNIACCLADVRLHTGRWSLADVRRFYTDDVAFAPARIVPETTRNSIFPGSRLMYWTGTTQIARLRAASPLSPRDFHDRLLSFGAAPVAWIAAELAA